MGRNRTSNIWAMPLEKFELLIKNSTSYREILRSFHLMDKGSNCKTLKQRIEEENIDDSHIKNRKLNQNAIEKNLVPIESLFVENSNHGRSVVRKRIIREKLLDNTVCAICGKKNEWEEKQLNLILDHINGVSNDHRLENLRFICPNCNSQLSTFAGRKNKKTYHCIKCGKEKHTKRPFACNECRDAGRSERKKTEKFNTRKAERPSKDVLIAEIEATNYCAVGRKYGVSDNAIRKWLKSYEYKKGKEQNE